MPPRVDEPQHVDRQQQQVQQQHRAQTGQRAVGDEGQVAGDGHAAQRRHVAHAEGGQHQAGRGIAEQFGQARVHQPLPAPIRPRCDGSMSFMAIAWVAHGLMRATPLRFELG
jgi:hypothetical protein